MENKIGIDGLLARFSKPLVEAVKAYEMQGLRGKSLHAVNEGYKEASRKDAQERRKSTILFYCMLGWIFVAMPLSDVRGWGPLLVCVLLAGWMFLAYLTATKHGETASEYEVMLLDFRSIVEVLGLGEYPAMSV